MNKRAIFVILALSFLQTGTTYVIKEGGKEVGRYEEPDGKNEVRDIEGVKPKKDTPASSAPASSLAPAAEIPDTWTLQGRVLDFVSAAPLPDGKLHLLSHAANVEIKINWNGMFSAKVPKLPEKESYQLVLEPPAGYTNHFLIYHSGQLGKLNERQRLAALLALKNPQPVIRVHDHYLDLEIAVLSDKAAQQKS